MAPKRVEQCAREIGSHRAERRRTGERRIERRERGDRGTLARDDQLQAARAKAREALDREAEARGERRLLAGPASSSITSLRGTRSQVIFIAQDSSSCASPQRS